MSDLRPIEYDERYWIHPKPAIDDKPAVKGHWSKHESKRGEFHGWATEGQFQDEFYAAAIIETPEGYVVTIPSHKVRFLDREEL